MLSLKKNSLQYLMLSLIYKEKRLFITSFGQSKTPFITKKASVGKGTQCVSVLKRGRYESFVKLPINIPEEPEKEETAYGN